MLDLQKEVKLHQKKKGWISESKMLLSLITAITQAGEFNKTCCPTV
jgi:hypothetical protein